MGGCTGWSEVIGMVIQVLYFIFPQWQESWKARRVRRLASMLESKIDIVGKVSLRGLV